MRILILLISLFCWAAVPQASYAGDEHKHAKGEQHSDEEKEDHSGHAHEKSKKKSKKKSGEKGHDHSEEDHDHDHDKGDSHKHGKGDGYKHNESSISEKGEAHGESHGHAHSEDESHDENDHAHSANDEHGDEKHAHAESDGHDGDHDDHGGGSGIGPGKAIMEVKDEGSKFKLSPESVKYLNITLEPIRISGNGLVTVSKKSLVRYQNTKGIYVKVGDWYEIKKVQVVEDNGQEVIIRTRNLNSNSKIATSGLGFLRAAHLQASGQGGKGHAH